KNTAGKEVVRIEELMVRADFMNLFRKKYVISSLHLERPYMYVEVDKKGRLISPLPSDEKPQPEKEAQKGPVTFEKIV
ncbi:MAG TPA: hypothetical protein PKM26_01860, partial [Syntrophorhabdaceae bacterium]|nr:hypothetical protein [Syntrophorhabdaceae bacterium]